MSSRVRVWCGVALRWMMTCTIQENKPIRPLTVRSFVAQTASRARSTEDIAHLFFSEASAWLRAREDIDKAKNDWLRSWSPTHTGLYY